MKYSLQWLSFDPLTIRFTGSGKDAKETLPFLAQKFQEAEYDREQSIMAEADNRSDLEEYERDNFYDR